MILTFGFSLDINTLRQAAGELRTMAADLAPGEQLNVITHSRGGDVGIEAAREGLQIDNFITLAAPKYDDLQPPLSNIGTWINVTTRQDWVQSFASWLKSSDSGNFSGAYNVQLNAKGYGHIAAHSAIWQNDQLRAQWWQVWQAHAQCHEWWDETTNTLHGCL
jgi:hypothetical protein